MSLSRRPARFKAPEFKEPKPITEEKFQVLRAAAARVYMDEQNDSAEKSSVQEVKNVAAGNNQVKITEEYQYENGVDLLASVAIAMDKKEKEKMLGKKKA